MILKLFEYLTGLFILFFIIPLFNSGLPQNLIIQNFIEDRVSANHVPDILPEYHGLPQIGFNKLPDCDNNYNFAFYHHNSVDFPFSGAGSYGGLNENIFHSRPDNPNRLLALGYSATGFVFPVKIHYTPTPVAVDANRMSNGTRRSAGYTSLASGIYGFGAKDSNQNNQMKERDSGIDFIIIPLFRKTWWTYLLVVGVIGAILFGIRQIELKKQEKESKLQGIRLRAEAAEFRAKALQAQKEIEKQQIRTRIATDLHDEIGSNLSSILLTCEMLSNNPRMPREFRPYLSDIYQAGRHSVSAIRDIIWFVNPMTDNLNDLTLRIKENTRHIPVNLSLEINERGVQDFQKINPDIKRNLYLIYREAMANIIKHSQAEKVVINICVEGEMFNMHIEDNGRGFNKEEISAGQGLINMRKRMTQIGGHLNLESRSGKGTRIHLRTKLT